MQLRDLLRVAILRLTSTCQCLGPARPYYSRLAAPHCAPVSVTTRAAAVDTAPTPAANSSDRSIALIGYVCILASAGRAAALDAAPAPATSGERCIAAVIAIAR